MSTARLNGNGEHTRQLHVERLGPREPEETQELKAAWRRVQLHWLATVPGYREQVKQRVAEQAREAERREKRMKLPSLHDVDNLGREVEGCG